MKQQATVRDQGGVDYVSGCRHHWIIEPPAGETSYGVCRICGQRKQFRNSAEDAGAWTTPSEREPLPRTSSDEDDWDETP